MSLNDTASAERVHIGFFGVRNAGKSSLVNRITNQEMSVVSDIKGTTTDSVRKAMELLPVGPVVIIDTPGIDDEGELGRKRVKSALKSLDMCDVAVLVTENETLSDLLEALFFFARAEIKEPTFRAFVEEHEELGRMFPVFGVKAVYDGKA